MPDDTVEVIEMDQWSQTGDLSEYTFETLREAIEDCGENEVPAIEGGDAEAARKIFGGRFGVKEVSESDSPKKGYVWFREGDDGDPEKWKYNYATT